MIALIRLGPPPGFDGPFACLPDLPPPPAARYRVFVVRCDSRVSVEGALTWFTELRRFRPEVSLVLVCEPPIRAMAALASASRDVGAVLPAWETEDPEAFADLLHCFDGQSVHARILERWIAQLSPVARNQRDLLTAIVTHGLRGGTLAGVARDLGRSERTIRRRLHALVPCDGTCILRRARIDSVYEMQRRGTARAVAIEAVGYSSSRAFEKARRRDRLCRVEGYGCRLRAAQSDVPCPFYAGTAA